VTELAILISVRDSIPYIADLDASLVDWSIFPSLVVPLRQFLALLNAPT
jgi:hypothetical protein